jgi:predicted dehydrogenase
MDRMLNFGVLGAGAIVPAALVNPARRRSDMRVVAVAARDGNRAQAFAAQHHIERSFGDYESLLADHADLPEEWFKDAVRHRWRHGVKLIPADWLDES